MAAGLYSVPQIILLLGNHAAGILMLIWGLIGYFSLFDFGLGRAVTQRMASHYAAADARKASAAGVTALIMLSTIGLLAGLLMYAVAPYFTQSWTKSGDLPASEIRTALLLVALTLPLVVVTAGLRGVLEAQNRFAASNLIRLPLGLWTFLSPVFAARQGADFSQVIAVLMAGRLIATVAYGFLIIRPLRGGRPERAEMRFMVGFGGWMTVSNLVSPIMTQLDRYVIAVLLTASAVTYFVTPYEIVMRIQLIAAAVTAAYLPQLAALRVSHSQALPVACEQAHRLVLGPTMGAAAVLFLFAHEFIALWINADFASHSALLTKILCVGIIFNSQALVPYTILQASAKPRLIAINHLVELPIYLALLWFATHHYGLVGAALASTARVTADYFLMQWQCQRLPELGKVRLLGFPTPHLVSVVILLVGLDAVAQSAWHKAIGLFALSVWCIASLRPALRARVETAAA